MKIAFLASDDQIAELLTAGINVEKDFIRAHSVSELVSRKADAYFDLCFEMDPQRINALAALLPAPVFVNDVVNTLQAIAQPFIRINAWKGFLNAKTMEAACLPVYREPAKDVLAAMGVNGVFVDDVPGLVRARIISTIINEAWYAFGEGVSSMNEIDLAMKLGTGYPYGPFEWGEKIGLHNVRALLSALQETDPLYDIAPALAAKTTAS